MQIRTISVWLTERCNLHCSYCYEQHPDVGFNEEAVKSRLLDLFRQGWIDTKAPELSLAFFGGEPLLEFEAMQRFIAWLEAEIPKRFRYFITTNGTLITPEIAQYLKDKGFGMLFSIDGDREAMVARGDSYDAVVAGWQCLQAVGMQPEANMTVTPEQLPRLMTNVEHVISLGFTAFNLNPLEPAAYDFDTVYTQFYSLFRRCLDEWLPQGTRTSALAQPFKMLSKPITEALREHGCGAGKGLIAISPTGEVYPCHHLVQTPATRLSHGIVAVDQQMKAFWESLNPQQNEECIKCPVRHLCMGSCPANNATVNCDFHRPVEGNCTFTRAKLTAALAIYSQCTPEQIAEVIGDASTPVC